MVRFGLVGKVGKDGKVGKVGSWKVGSWKFGWCNLLKTFGFEPKTFPLKEGHSTIRVLFSVIISDSLIISNSLISNPLILLFYSCWKNISKH